MHNMVSMSFSWSCKKSWKISGKNTLLCLLGCSIGNYVTLWLFQMFAPQVPTALVFLLAPIVGLLTSVSLEAFFLARQLQLQQAVRVALGMSFISMIAMQLAANFTNLMLVGKAHLVWWAIMPSLLAGFLSVWPYNYYKVKKYGKSCH